ncbi:hypothetical protein ABIB62_003284 [Mucilaginibacter sp. UYP25]|uniref:hypothetical protein n=1 Tax=unclassified Mucilaginibacter TaxID=2617802 RepID=UPI00339A9A5F
MKHAYRGIALLCKPVVCLKLSELILQKPQFLSYIRNESKAILLNLFLYFDYLFLFMWLKIVYEEGFNTHYSKELNKVRVSISNETSAPVEDFDISFRVSPIFPLLETEDIPDLSKNKIYFFNYSNAFRALGRIISVADEEVKKCVFFSIGLSSVILISDDDNILNKFKKVIELQEYANEEWEINDFKIVSTQYNILKKESLDDTPVVIANYDVLPLTERALVDEFNISIRFLLIKLHHHMPLELPKFKRLVDEVNAFILELVYLTDFSGEMPESLNEFTTEDLKGEKLNTILKNQSLDRIIQINSALSYVSTQAFSGAIPILERRSLVRRSSLLGIGSAILALNNIARFIEDSFSKIGFNEIITDIMAVASPLKGIDNLPVYLSSDWQESSISNLTKDIKSHNSYYKLPYFNGRLGFRETEYSIAAAIQSITSGATLEWSLMTVTHEMLHGHVRTIITSIFYGDDKMTSEEQRRVFYSNFKKKITKKEKDSHLIDSIRSILFTYCCLTQNHGSITSKGFSESGKYDFTVPNEPMLWNLFEQENRNINEIFVHVLDLHYFYASRLSAYIPLIWCSWVAVPYVTGDLRQYILRSLLTIASKNTGGSSYERFNLSVSRLKELLIKYKDNKLKHPIILEVINILNDNDKLMNSYFNAFKNSVLIVDMITNIFISPTVRSAIINDDFVKWESNDKDEDNFEEAFKYELPDGFNDEVIKSPISFLLDRMIKQLNDDNHFSDIERETAIQFMALNSNN